ncbi:MAG: efflux RND transporter periplasmic adaptor subunit [Bacteroidetes bacterium]|nr:efflux RND transporter periplasmic adaptor subunit [Bacteroidota bacterium]
MKTIFTYIIAFTLLALISFKLVSNKQLAQARVYHYNPDFPILVDVVSVQRSNESTKHVFRGQFEAGKESKLSVDIQGKVLSVSVDVGQSVKKGQVLLQLDQSLLNLQLQAAQIQHKSLQADLKRTETLAEQQAVQKVQLEKMQNAVESAEIQVKTIQEQLSKTTLRAPFDGIITQKLTETGSFAAPGMPVFILSDMETLRFTFQSSEQDLGFINDSHSLSVTADVFPDLSFSAKPLFTNAKAGMSNQYTVQVEVKNSTENSLKSGMFGRINIQIQNDKPILKIPARALLGSVENPLVYTIIDGKAYKSPIQFIEHNGKEILITSGLNQGDDIVVGGLVHLYDGALVQISGKNTSQTQR